MSMQGAIVAVIVCACAVYAAWVLMPAALRRAIAQRLQRGPWPEALARRLRQAANTPAGCACDAGCSAKSPPPGAVQPIRLHRRPPA